MNFYPIHKSLIDFNDEYLRECFIILSSNLNFRHLSKFYHLDILNNHHLLIKIEKYYENGSLRDLIFNSVNYFFNFIKKYTSFKNF